MLSDPATSENGDLYWMVLYDRGRIAEREGDVARAIEFYRRAIDVIEKQRSSLNTEASKIGFVGNKQAVYRDLVRALVAQGKAADAFGYVERAKARALVDLLASKRDFAVQGANADQVRALLSMADSAENAARALDRTEDGAQRRGVVAQAHRALAEQAPELASLVSVSALGAADVEKRVPEGEALVEYYYGDGAGELYAFVVSRSGLRVRTLNAAGLDDAIRAFRFAVQNPASPSAWRPRAKALYDRLIAPIEPLDAERLTIVAHGALHYLPFDALHDGDRFLVERYPLRMLPAASVLQFLRAAPAEKPGLVLAFGNPDLGNPKLDLAFAQAEAESIASSMPRSRALVRKQASKDAFGRYSGGFRYIHIASHGEFDPDAPLKSALLLAGEHGEGALTVGELYSMRIDADLVTLSACETGLGKIASGDDVVGLTRGFLYGGARSIVASLWQVDDRATGRLMTAFYDGIKRGEDKRAALRDAQLATMKAYPHPFFWAAFELTGRAD
jgi:CHAT domain-containing protein